ncbi:MAG: hypothetical protein QW667_05030 [Candidatus Bathyarchaeia archaeon]
MPAIEPLLWFYFIIVLIFIVYFMLKEIAKPKPQALTRSRRAEPSELDLRLTYKRFKELFPYYEITYEEYKKLQMQKAFKKAVSSEKNKRMVR